MTSRLNRRAGRRATRDITRRLSVSSGRSALVKRVLSILAREGLLLLSDARLPSIAGLVAGAPVRGSWWGHPAGQAIYQVSEALADHPDVAVNPLGTVKNARSAREILERIVNELNARCGADGRLPWQVSQPNAGARLRR